MISGAVRQAAPVRKPGARCHPWWTPELTALHQAATVAKRALNRQPNHPHTRDVYRRADARLRHTLKQARKQHTELRLTSATRTNFWHIYRDLKAPEHTKVIKPLLKPDGTLTQSPLETAEHLAAAWFPPTGPHVAPQNTYSAHEQRWRADRTRLPRRATRDLTEQEVGKAVFEAEPLSAAPTTSFPALALQQAWPLVSTYICELFQACLVNAHHPTSWKRAQVSAVPKPGKDNYSTAKSYRPIALLLVLSKALEKVLAHRLTHYATTGALPTEHHGGLPSHAREQALLTLTEQIKQHHRSKQTCILVKTDITSAFDQASHSEICHSLRRRGVPPREVAYIKSFLSGRSAEVRIADATVCAEHLHKGVPQGSPLSPILWLFYTADLLELMRAPNSTVAGWLDDVTVLVAGTSPTDAAHTATQLLRKAAWWSKHTGSKFAPQKCESMLMRRQRTVGPWKLL